MEGLMQYTSKMTPDEKVSFYKAIENAIGYAAKLKATGSKEVEDEGVRERLAIELGTIAKLFLDAHEIDNNAFHSVCDLIGIKIHAVPEKYAHNTNVLPQIALIETVVADLKAKALEVVERAQSERK